MNEEKPIAFRGTSLDDLRSFPQSARRDAGYQLELVQQNLEPNDWKPMPTIGLGVKEIRTQDPTGAYRVIYIAKFAGTVYVLHCFQKKTQKTSKKDLELATNRYKNLIQELR